MAGVRKLVLLVLLAALLIAGVVVDAAAEARAEDEVATAVEAGVGNVGEVEAGIDSFPFLGRLLVQERVPTLRVRLTDLAGYGIGVAELVVVAEDIRLDRDVLLDGDVKVTGVGHVRAEARITEAELSRATGAEVELLGGGQARITVQGVTATADAEVVDGHIRFAVDPLPALSLPLPTSTLLPCKAEVEVVAGALLASCEAERLPRILLDVIG
jgi:hypothetical protein